MATEKFLKTLLTDLSSLSLRTVTQQEADALLSAYNAAFRGVRDSALMEAAALYKAEGKYFPPKPSELSQYITRQQEEPAGDYRIRPEVRCSTCGKIALCIQEPAFGGPLSCRQCYTGMSDAKFRENMKSLARADKAKGITVSYNEGSKTVVVHNNQTTNEIDDIFGG